MATGSAPPRALQELVGRCDADVADFPAGRARVRLDVRGGETWDAIAGRRRATLERANGSKADACLAADGQTWAQIAADVRTGMAAFGAGRLTIRRNLHVGVGFLAATSPTTGLRRMHLETLDTGAGRIPTVQAGAGPTVLAIHGLGASKASFLPTLEALADGFRVVAMDLPGFGDPDKPLGAPCQRAIVDRVVPGAEADWTAAGIDEFMRAFLTPRGRAAFYATARQIYLEEPEGEKGFWPRLAVLDRDALFVWGRQDRLVPIAFARHVSETAPGARHLALNCGHVPQLERPRETHRALIDFLGAA